MLLDQISDTVDCIEGCPVITHGKEFCRSHSSMGGKGPCLEHLISYLYNDKNEPIEMVKVGTPWTDSEILYPLLTEDEAREFIGSDCFPPMFSSLYAYRA